MAGQHDKPGRLAAKEQSRHTRTLKVRQGGYLRIIKDKHHSHFDRTIYTSVPWINIQGQWLERAGFTIHTPIKVRVMPGCLVVTVEDSPTL